MRKTSQNVPTFHKNRDLLPQNGGSEALTGGGAEKIAAILGTSGSPVSESTSETPKFGLTLAEKQSIEADITSKKPIGDTLAYRTFLKNIFPNKEPTFPYLADYDDAVIVISKLSELLGKSIRLPNKTEAVQSMKENNHLAGCRGADDGRVENASDIGYAWISAEMQGLNAPCAWRYRDGLSVSVWGSRRHGHSVIPIFG